MVIGTTKMLTHALLTLSKYHPVVVEGMGYYDPRDPALVANNIYTALQRHWKENPLKDDKPKLIITQGDPLADRGISAITPRVAELLGVSRCLIYLDEEIASYHSPNADRENVSLEIKYSFLTSMLVSSSGEEELKDTNKNENSIALQNLEQTVEKYLEQKNLERQKLGKELLKDYFRDFALLQEVTKAACFQTCGDVTIVHTAKNISDFSVTSFYKVGLELGLVHPHHYVSYPDDDELDFNKIDTR